MVLLLLRNVKNLIQATKCLAVYQGRELETTRSFRRTGT